MKKLLLVLLSLTLIVSMIACGGSKPDASSDSSEGDFGELHVKILDSEKSTAYGGGDVLVVYYEFTNNRDEDASYFITMMDRAFQNGEELEAEYVLENDLPELENSHEDVSKGNTLKVASVFVLKDDSDVTVEVTGELSYESGKLSKVFSIK